MQMCSLWRGPITRQITMADIIRETAEDHGLTADDLKGSNRRRHIAWARQDAMWRMRREGRWSSTQIGLALGGRDHATVLWGIKRHLARIGSMSGVMSFAEVASGEETQQNQDGSVRCTNTSPALTQPAPTEGLPIMLARTLPAPVSGFKGGCR